MSEHDTAASADASTVTATFEQPISMTLDGVAGLLAMEDDDAPASEPSASNPATPDEPEGTVSAETPDEPAEAEASEEETPDEGEPEETTDEPTQDEPAGYDWEKVPGDATFRTRDGKAFTAAEIKAQWDDLQTARQMREQGERERAEFQQQRTQAAQQYQQFLPIAQQAIQAIQASLPRVPDAPDPSLLHSDPLRFHELRALREQAVEEYNRGVGNMRQIAAQAQHQQQQAQAEQKQDLDNYIQEQQKALFDAMPDLRDEGKRKEFYSDLKSTLTGQEYGFSLQEVDGIHDARLMKVLRKAIKYDQLMAKGKPRPNTAPVAAGKGQPQTAPRAPVAQPGRRTSAPEKEATRKTQLMAQARAKGGVDLREAASLIMLDD